jgi:hypothetical protein
MAAARAPSARSSASSSRDTRGFLPDRQSAFFRHSLVSLLKRAVMRHSMSPAFPRLAVVPGTDAWQTPFAAFRLRPGRANSSHRLPPALLSPRSNQPERRQAHVVCAD